MAESNTLDRVTEHAILRLHITYSGDAGVASGWVPFGKSKIRELLKEQAKFDGNRNQARFYRPDPAVLIQARVVGADRFLHIEVKPPCVDRRGFLLSRRGQVYDALYTDGLVENINPIDGTPRPVPDIAVRTKGYKVPMQLRRGTLDRVSASNFSGLMRKVVGCYHASGRDAPFSFTHAVTHGIVKHETVVNNKTVTLHWLIEISAQGLFAAPINGGSKCCDSWSVSAYQPTPKTSAPISLQGAFTREVPKVQMLASQSEMAEVYSDGDPWHFGSGWAFSASGALAQTVLMRLLTTPAKHYKCSRWKIAFSFEGPVIGATLIPIERNKVATLVRNNNMVWTPVADGLWVGAWGAGAESPNPITTFPTQSAPIFVYYDGEEEVLVRWQLTRTTVPATGRVFSLHLVDLRDSLTTSCPFGAGVPFWPDGLLWERQSKGFQEGFNYLAHTRTVAGFSCTSRFNHVNAFSSKTGDYDDYVFEKLPTFSIVNVNTYTLDPACYFINDSGVLVTGCTSTFLRTCNGFWWYINRVQGTFSEANQSSIVIFAEEREAVLAVNLRAVSQTAVKSVSLSSAAAWWDEIITEKIDSGPCPYETTVHENVPHNTELPLNLVVTPDTTIFTTENSDERSVTAVLCLDDLVATAALGIGPAPFYPTDNWNLETFLSHNPDTKPYAESNVHAQHGNLHYPDIKLTPPDQRANRAYLLDNETVITGGFSESLRDPVGFVGRV